MTFDKAKADELSKLVVSAAGHYSQERATVGDRYSAIIRYLGEALAHYTSDKPEEAREAIKRSCEIAYDLTGDCAQIDPIAALVGYDADPESTRPAEPGAVIDADYYLETDEPPAELEDAVCGRVREWLRQAAPRLVRTLQRDGVGEGATLTLRLQWSENDEFEVALREEIGLGEVDGRIASKDGGA